MSTITASNCKLSFTVRSNAGIVVGPFTVQGFASDDAFATEVVDSAEAVMGVDGRMSAGKTPYITRQTITLMADSPSIDLFEDWNGAQNVPGGDLLFADGALSYPGLSKSYVLSKGALTRLTPMPQAKKVLQPVTYEIAWELVQPAPIVV